MSNLANEIKLVMEIRMPEAKIIFINICDKTNSRKKIYDIRQHWTPASLTKFAIINL